MVYPYFKAYLIKPFRFFMYIRSYLGFVNVASSKPPGKSPIVLPEFIIFFIWKGSTASTPHNLKNRPIIGTFSINRLLRAVMLDILLLSAFMLAKIPKLGNSYSSSKCYEDETQTNTFSLQWYFPHKFSWSLRSTREV